MYKIKWFTFILLLITINSLIFPQEKPLSLEELCTVSSDVIMGEPVLLNSYKSADGKHVYTDIDIKVKRKFKGNLKNNNIIRISTYGGTIGDITTHVVGFPKFFKNMNSIYFFKETLHENLVSPQRQFLISGLTQGKLDIVDQGGQKVIKRAYDLPLEYKSKGKKLSLSKDDPTTLGDMVLYINQVLTTGD